MLHAGCVEWSRLLCLRLLRARQELAARQHNGSNPTAELARLRGGLDHDQQHPRRPHAACATRSPTQRLLQHRHCASKATQCALQGTLLWGCADIEGHRVKSASSDQEDTYYGEATTALHAATSDRTLTLSNLSYHTVLDVARLFPPVHPRKATSAMACVWVYPEKADKPVTCVRRGTNRSVLLDAVRQHLGSTTAVWHIPFSEGCAYARTREQAAGCAINERASALLHIDGIRGPVVVGTNIGGVLFNLMRPEFVASCEEPLSSDALTGFGGCRYGGRAAGLGDAHLLSLLLCFRKCKQMLCLHDAHRMNRRLADASYTLIHKVQRRNAGCVSVCHNTKHGLHTGIGSNCAQAWDRRGVSAGWRRASGSGACGRAEHPVPAFHPACGMVLPALLQPLCWHLSHVTYIATLQTQRAINSHWVRRCIVTELVARVLRCVLRERLRQCRVVGHTPEDEVRALLNLVFGESANKVGGTCATQRYSQQPPTDGLATTTHTHLRAWRGPCLATECAASSQTTPQTTMKAPPLQHRRCWPLCSPCHCCCDCVSSPIFPFQHSW